MKTVLLNAAAAVAVVGIILLSPESSSATDVPQGYSVDVEQGKPDSGETRRTHVYNREKKKVSMIIDYADGRREVHTYRPDGSAKQKSVSHPAGQREVFDYYGDGKLMRETRDGIVLFERRKLADGTFEAIRFKSDGKSPQMLRRVGPGGGFELIHYRTGSPAVWFKFRMSGGSGKPEWEFFAKDGSRLRRVMGDKEMVVTGYDKVGDFLFEQVWTLEADGSYKLKSVSVRRNTTFRRFLVEGGKVETVEDLGLDGEVEFTWKADQVDAPDARLLKEYFEDEDPTVPESEE